MLVQRSVSFFVPRHGGDVLLVVVGAVVCGVVLTVLFVVVAVDGLVVICPCRSFACHPPPGSYVKVVGTVCFSLDCCNIAGLARETTKNERNKRNTREA